MCYSQRPGSPVESVKTTRKYLGQRVCPLKSRLPEDNEGGTTTVADSQSICGNEGCNENQYRNIYPPPNNLNRSNSWKSCSGSTNSRLSQGRVLPSGRHTLLEPGHVRNESALTGYHLMVGHRRSSFDWKLHQAGCLTRHREFSSPRSASLPSQDVSVVKAGWSGRSLSSGHCVDKYKRNDLFGGLSQDEQHALYNNSDQHAGQIVRNCT